MAGVALVLDDHDPRVVRAREAERRLHAAYGLEGRTEYVRLLNPAIRVRVSLFGEGPPVLVVPGNTGDAFPLTSLLAGLAGHRIVAVNRPGGGLSEGMDHRTVEIRRFAVETLVTVLDALGLDRVDVVAHSMGAHWALWLAMDRPERVRRLVLLGKPGNVMGGRLPLALRLLVGSPIAGWVAGLMVPRRKAQALRPLRMMGHGPEVLARQPEAFRDCYFHFRRLPHYVVSLVSLMQNAPARMTAADLAGVVQPVALLWGTLDTFGGVELGAAIAAALPRGELHVLDGAGHLPWLEDPVVAARLVGVFLEG